MKEKLIASRISPAKAIGKIGTLVTLPPGIPAALGLEDQLEEGARGLIVNAIWSERNWPHFTVAFGCGLRIEGMLEFEVGL